MRFLKTPKIARRLGEKLIFGTKRTTTPPCLVAVVVVAVAVAAAAVVVVVVTVEILDF